VGTKICGILLTKYYFVKIINVMASSNKSYPNVPWMIVSFGHTYAAGDTIPTSIEDCLVRFKAIGATKFRLSLQPDSEIVMTDGETEYFFIPPDDTITIISGSLNLMATGVSAY
jgi:hypothetical protein